jgi:UDP-glucose 4-epimerase
MRKMFITGGAGFIGSNLAERLVHDDYIVTVFDNLLSGKEEFLTGLKACKRFRFIKADLLDLKKLKKEIAGQDTVWHMAANSDIAQGTKYTDIDLKLGTIATYNVLESMRSNGIKEIVFASSSAVYSIPKVMPTPENYGPLFPISLYGASKLASEGLISAFCHNYHMKSWIFRFANIVGDNGTHGVVFDFIHKLRKNQRELEILGNGKQAKPYLYVKECVDGMIYGFNNSKEKINYFNLACEGATSVERIASIIVEEMDLREIIFKFTGGERGWVGDVPQVRLDSSKMTKLGWKPKLMSDEAVRKGVKALLKQI